MEQISIFFMIKSKIKSEISDRISDQIYDNACHQVFEIIYHEVRRKVNFETLYYF